MSGVQETLSSNSLFHFTKDARSLLGILKNGISPRYCLETFSMFDFGLIQESEVLELAVPMACFCDIPLSKVKHHLSFYGSYGIAFSKDWGETKGVSPLLYIYPKSETSRSIQDAIFYFTQNNAGDESSVATYQKVLRLVRFTKPYKGNFWRNGKYLENIRFYDEREWRFVPDIYIGDEYLRPWIPKEDYLNDILKSSLDSKLSELHSLTFTLEDIRYLIIPSNKDISAMIDYLEKNLIGHFDAKDVKKLISKVLTKEQIEEDF